MCVAADDAAAGVASTWAPVGGWAATGAGLTCAQTFVDNGGYGEMSVTGTASGCGAVDRVFNRVNYCPFRCNANPGGPGCTDCNAGSTGTF